MRIDEFRMTPSSMMGVEHETASKRVCDIGGGIREQAR